MSITRAFAICCCPLLLPVALVALAWSVPGVAGASPARAQALGGYDLNYPNSINTFVYFEDDVNIFVNPAHVYRYRDLVTLSMGFENGTDSGMGLRPYGGFLLEPGDSQFVIGAFVNRDLRLFGEGDAIQDVLGGLVLGGLGGGFDTGFQGGDGSASASPVFPVDLFIGGGTDTVSFGFNAMIAGGQDVADSRTLVNPANDMYAVSEMASKSMYTSLRAGFALESGDVRPEVTLGFTKVDGWAAAFAYNTEDGEGEPSISHTEGLEGVARFSGGFRMPITVGSATVIPYVGYATAWGHTFVDENLGDRVMIENAQNNENRYSSMNLNAGAGIVYEPEEDLRIIWTASAQVRRLRHRTNDHRGDLDEDTPDGSETTSTDDAATSAAVPVLGIAGEYRAFKHLWLRGAVRGNVAWARDYASSTTVVGPDTVDEIKLSGDQGATPSLVASCGFSIPAGPLSLDASVGGLIMGSADTQFFSRLDLVIYFQ